MSIYNNLLYNTELYNARTGLIEGTGALEQEDGTIVVDKWFSPLYRRYFPRHFYEVLGYERFMQMYRFYLEFLEQGKNPYWVLSHISELASIQNTLKESLPKLRDDYAPDFRFEDFPDMDERKFLENSKRFYSRKGTNKSFEFLFQMLGKEITVLKPIDDTLFIGENSVIGDQKLIDSFYYTPFTYDVITDLPYAEWNEFIRRLNHPIGTQMFGTFLVLLANQMLLFPSINTNIPNVAESLVNVTNTVPASGNFTVEVSGDITDFPDPDDPSSEDTLILRIGDEDMLYTDKGDQAFLITGRGLNNTREQAVADASQFFVDVANNQLVYTDRIDHYTGKVINFTTDDTLPTPLVPERDYYATLVEHKTTLIGNILLSDLSLTVDDASSFPTAGGKLYINGEILGYSAIVGNTFTVTRGQDSTIAVGHSDNSTVYLWSRTIQVSDTLSDALNRVYIPIVDQGVGSHIVSGLGVLISLFTGFAVIRPQALVVRELIAYTSYEDVNRNLFTEDLLNISFKSTIGGTAASQNIDIVSAATNPFSLGERVRFSTETTFLTSAIDDVVTTIPVDDTTEFLVAGFAKIGYEFIQYTGKTGVSLTGVTRGVSGSTAASYGTAITVRPRMLTDSSGELDGIYFVNRGPGALQFQLVEIDENDAITSTITIQDDVSGTTYVELYDIDRGQLYNNPATVVTQVSGATATIDSASGRVLVLDVSAGKFTDAATTFTEGAVNGDVTGNIFNTLGEYQLWQYDFGDITFDDIENGGDAFAKELSVRFPMLREEQARTIVTPYKVLTMSDEVGLLSDWQADTVTAIGSWVDGSVGHVYTDGATLERGIIRGYVDNFRPIIEVVPGDDLTRDVIDVDEIITTVGSDTIIGDFSALTFTPSQQKYCIDISGTMYIVISLVDPTHLQLASNVVITGLVSGDTYIQSTNFYGNFTIGVSVPSYSGRHCATKEAYGLNTGAKVDIFKFELTSDVDESANWIPTTDTVFNANLKGHVKQLVTNAEGFIRAKNTVSSVLNTDITDIETTIPMSDTSQFPSSGRVRIGTEFVVYTGKTVSELTGLSRGANNTSAVLHASGTSVISNNVDEEPSDVYIETDSGTFSTQVTDALSVGNGAIDGNDVRIATTKTDLSKNDPSIGDYFYVADTDITDPNRYGIYEVTDVINISGSIVVAFDESFSEPVAANGTVNWLNLY